MHMMLHSTIGPGMQGKIGQTAASDQRHLPANMVPYLLAQPAAETAV